MSETAGAVAAVQGTGAYHPAAGAATLTGDALHGLAALAADAIVCTDAGFRILLCNPAAERMFGYLAGELVNQPIEVLLPERARDEQLARLSDSAEAGRAAREPRRIWGRRRTGELFPAEASVSRIVLDHTLHVAIVVRDITLRQRHERERELLLQRETEAHAAAERASRRSEFLARAGELLHSSLDYTNTFGALLKSIVPELATYCIVDVLSDAGLVTRLHVVHADPAMQPLADRLRAYPRRQSAYMTRRAIVHGEPELVSHVTDELLRSRVEDDEHLALVRRLAPASFMIVPLRARQRVLGALFFARDASASAYTPDDLALAVALAQSAAAALDNAQLYDRAQHAVRVRDDVLGVVSHDLRNPLTVISMCATSLLTHGAGDEERAREALRTIQRSTHWAQRLIQDLLDVSAIEAGGLSVAPAVEDPVVLVTRAAMLFERMAAEHGLALRTDVPEHLPLIRADGDRLLQALGNLVSNAVRFTPEGGVILLGAAAETDGVRFFVLDGGPGVPEDDVPHVFDRFWTAQRSSRARGTGMGLAIVRGIAEAHRGRAWVQRAASGGAAFNVLIPALPRE